MIKKIVFPLILTTLMALVSSCGSKKTGSGNIDKMNLEELAQAQTYYEQKGHDDTVAIILKRRIKLSKDHHELAELNLQAAQIALKMEQYEKAQSMYANFKTLYPGNKHIKEALYQEIVSHFLTISIPDRDQAATTSTMLLAHNFLEEYPHDEEFAPRVREYLQKCYQNILAGEVNRMAFYLTRYHIDGNERALIAARKRLTYAELTVLPELTLYDARFYAVSQRINAITKKEEVQSPEIIQIIIEDLQKMLQEVISAPKPAIPVHQRF